MENKRDEGLRNIEEQYFQRVPRWPFFIAIVTIGLLLSVLSESLTIGPSWLLPLTIIVLLIPMSFSIRNSDQKKTRQVALLITGLITVGLVSSVIFLVYNIITHAAVNAVKLFIDSAILWILNIAVFTVWYWEIDQGGPYIRHNNKLQPIDFLFPQMYSDSELWRNWKPGLADYLFLAFNTSAAFGPTDTMVMSRRAKILMNTQALISIVIVAVVAAHAVGAL